MATDFKIMDAAKFVKLFKLLNNFGQVTPDKMLVLNSAGIENDTIGEFYLTCVKHPWSRYVTKNPWTRKIHLLQGPHGLDSMIDDECGCAFTDLRVVKE